MLKIDLEWLNQLISTRVLQYVDKTNEIEIPSLFEIDKQSDDAYSKLIVDNQLQLVDRTIFLLGLATHVQPDVFHDLISSKIGVQLKYPSFGGVLDNQTNTFIPTVQTALFLLAGNDYYQQQQYYKKIKQSLLLRYQIVELNDVSTQQTVFGQVLSMTRSYVEHIYLETELKQEFSMDFPAQKITTPYQFEDIILDHDTIEELQEIIDWVDYGKLMYEIEGNKARKGYPCLFYGPPGTGKTMVAGIVGKICKKEVYQIDLSMVVSKYIGETEKNLAKLFDKAEDKDWILFFDEADSLFGKRSQIKDANDKYANQEVSFLLQRMETFRGVTILATNFVQNIDAALTRRFQSKINFPKPKAENRTKLWMKLLPKGFEYEQVLMKNMNTLGQRFELTGANIKNILQKCCIQSLKREERMITSQDIEVYIKVELAKEGKSV